VNVVIDTRPLTLAVLRAAWLGPVHATLGAAARERIAASHALIREVVAGGKRVYGVNTGFGQLAQVRIGSEKLALLQENLVRSHAVGVGPDLDDRVVRLVLLTKIAALGAGCELASERGANEGVLGAAPATVSRPRMPSVVRT